MTDIEKKQWNDLYQYVKKEILFYDNSQSIPPSLILRLKGLAKGKYIENRRIKDNADYSFEVILYTFKICRPAILKAVSNKEFENEKNKFNYICKIIENNINDVYSRLIKIKNSDDKINSLDTRVLSHKAGKYQRKTEDIKNKKLNELW